MATAGKIKGNAWHIYKNIGGTYTKVGEATSATVTINSDTIDLTTKDSNEFTELIPSIKRAEVSVEGVVRYDQASAVDVDDIITDILAGTKLTIITGTFASGDKYAKFDAYFTSVEQSATFDDRASFTASMSSTGTISLVAKT